MTAIPIGTEFIQNFERVAGDDFDIVVPVTDRAGAAVSLTGFTAEWRMGLITANGGTLKVRKTSTGGQIVIDGSGGILTITVLGTDTRSLKPGKYFHEVKVTDTGDDDVITVATGVVTLRPSLPSA